MGKTVKSYARIMIEIDGQKVLGPGRVELIENIIETGSISSAAQKMGMSYQKASQMVSELNHAYEEDIILTWKGGKSNGGAKVSEKGMRLMQDYKLLRAKVQSLLNEAVSDFSP